MVDVPGQNLQQAKTLVRQCIHLGVFWTSHSGWSSVVLKNLILQHRRFPARVAGPGQGGDANPLDYVRRRYREQARGAGATDCLCAQLSAGKEGQGKLPTLEYRH